MSLPRWHLLGVTAAFALAALAAGGASGSAAGIPTLYVNYQTNCTFTLTDDQGSAVTSIAPGSYQLEVTTPDPPFGDGTAASAGSSSLYDCGGAVNFQLTGPGGVDFSTTLGNGASDNQLLSAQDLLASSSYTAVDENNPASAITFATAATGTPIASPAPEGSSSLPVTKTSSTSSPSPAQSSALSKDAATYRGRLEATVSATGKLRLTSDGKEVRSIAAGRYTVTAVDHSAKRGFVLQKIDGAPITVAKAGSPAKHSVSVTLTAGQWSFSASPNGAKTFFYVDSK